MHFKAEGDVEFKALLFVPQRAPWDFYDNIQRPKSSGGAAPGGRVLVVCAVFAQEGKGGSNCWALVMRELFVSSAAPDHV